VHSSIFLCSNFINGESEGQEHYCAEQKTNCESCLLHRYPLFFKSCRLKPACRSVEDSGRWKPGRPSGPRDFDYDKSTRLLKCGNWMVSSRREAAQKQATEVPLAWSSPAFGNPARSDIDNANVAQPPSALRPSFTRGVPLSFQVRFK